MTERHFALATGARLILRPWWITLVTALSCAVACDAGIVSVAFCTPTTNAPTGKKTSLLAQCGATLEFEEVNSYGGDFPHVDSREGAVVLVDGACSGTLIDGGDAGVLVLTAGHCVEPNEDVFIVFNHEVCPDGPEEVINGVVLERSLTPDFALIGIEATNSVEPTRLSALLTNELAVIQHPRGGTKVISEGNFLEEDTGGVLRYVELDTLVGGSGAGILNTRGDLVGVHTNGDCNESGGSNSGWNVQAILENSSVLNATVFEKP